MSSPVGSIASALGDLFLSPLLEQAALNLAVGLQLSNTAPSSHLLPGVAGIFSLAVDNGALINTINDGGSISAIEAVGVHAGVDLVGLTHNFLSVLEHV